MSAPAETGREALHRPPAPIPAGEVRTVLNVLFGRDFNLLTALSRSTYGAFMGRQTFLQRRIYLVNDPVTVREILVDKADSYPKADAFVDALAPLVGDGVFVSNGETWRRQRAMIRPALSQMSLRGAHPHMAAAADDCVARLEAAAAAGSPIALDAAFSHVTADVIFRTIFSEPIEAEEAHAVFEAFATVQTLSDQLSVRRLLYAARTGRPSRPKAFEAAARLIRDTIGRMVDRRLAAFPKAGADGRDIAAELTEAAEPGTGRRFDREELIDQIAVFFLAGHETTASLLTWTVVILAAVPDVTARIRAEIAALGPGPPSLDTLQNGLPFLRGALREVLRLYPPVGFLMRTPLAPDRVRGFDLRPGDVVVISPWTMHRHTLLWPNPDRFDPERFAPERAGAIVRDSYIPFGLGPRICPGAAFALLESTLILARLLGAFAFEPAVPDAIRATARLTVRPRGSVMCRVSRRR